MFFHRVWFSYFYVNFLKLSCYFGFNCILRGEDGEKEEKAKEDRAKQKLRQLHTHRYGEPEIQESAFWKKIIAYQQKLLVSCFLPCGLHIMREMYLKIILPNRKRLIYI